ncbi:ATP-binding protein [Nocardia sp. NPDC004260]
MDSRSHRAGDVPASAPGFVNRDREREMINSLLLRAVRLITLTGPGGIGKTRLAAETLRRARKTASGRNRIYWVRMARLAKDATQPAVEEEIAHAVMDSDLSGRSAWDTIVSALIGVDGGERNSRPILVLDNCEHVHSSAAGVASDLLDAIAELTIVATSREPLGWVDEHIIRVPPLTNQDALSFFLQRAELTGSPITGTDQIQTAAAICRRVNNQPLYIQLAAARLMHCPPAMILRGLTGQADDSRLAWSHGPYGIDPRHRAVTDVVEWSYNLCSEEERLLFERLSVFASGYDLNPDDPDFAAAPLDVGADLDAIASICGDDSGGRDGPPKLLPHEIQGLLERLVDHSLVSVHMSPSNVRYSLVESLRVYAQHRLRQRSTNEVDKPTLLAKRHLYYYRDKVMDAVGNSFTPLGQDQRTWTLAAWSNIKTAIETSLNLPEQSAAGLEICLGLFILRIPFATGSIREPFATGSVRETRDWTQRCLDATRSLARPPTELQIMAMAAIAWLALVQGCEGEAERILDDCIALYTPDPEIRTSWRYTAESDIGLPAVIELIWGVQLLFIHGDAKAITVLSRARDKFHACGDHNGAASCELHLALAAGILGTAQQANEITRRYLDRASVFGTQPERSWAEYTRSIALTEHGDPYEALVLQRASLAYQLASGDQSTALVVIQARMWSLARIISAGEADRDRLVALATEIAYLAGGAKTLRARLGLAHNLRPLTDKSAQAIVTARQLLGADAYAAAENQGVQLRPEHQELQRLALGTFTIDTSRDRRTAEQKLNSRWQELSPAERQVAVLAAAGWSNAAIADRRSKSVRTIDAQVTAVLHKLMISSREDIIEHVPRNAIDQVRLEASRRPQRTGRKR